MEFYLVRPGDTVWGIARRFGVPARALQESNGLPDAGLIKPGQILRIPDGNGESAPVTINRTAMRFTGAGYIAEVHPKDLVVLHFTAGTTARGAFDEWVRGGVRVGTAYIVDLDGTVYETFDPRYWAFHLGVKAAIGAANLHDRRSIGIEIVNPGPLVERDGWLHWWPPANRFERRWCRVEETGKYVRKSYRGFGHFAVYTPEQIGVVPRLVRDLCERFGIPKAVPPAGMRGTAAPAGFFRTFQGVASHQNFRADKFDVGPAFPWESLNGLVRQGGP